MQRTVSLSLNSVEELFTVPDSDPFADSPTVEAGVDQLAVELKTRPGVPDRVVLLLPGNAIDATVRDRAERALRRWCDRAVLLADRESAALRWRGVKALQAGLLFLAVCLAVATLIEEAAGAAGLLTRLVGEGLVIAGWVGLWVPVEILIYDRLVVVQRRRLYRAMRGLTVEVRGRDGAGPSPAPTDPTDATRSAGR